MSLELLGLLPLHFGEQVPKVPARIPVEIPLVHGQCQDSAKNGEDVLDRARPKRPGSAAALGLLAHELKQMPLLQLGEAKLPGASRPVTRSMCSQI